LDTKSEFDRCKKWIEAALEYSGGTHTIEDIRAGVMADRFALLPLENCALVVERTEYPRKHALHVFLAGGDLQEIKSTDQNLVRMAKLLGCARIDISGRRGWVRALRDIGYFERWVTVSKDVEQ